MEKKILNIAVVPLKRNVTIFDERKGKTVFVTEAQTWGELKKEISQQGYNLTNTKATEGVSYTTFEHDEAQLPNSIKTRNGVTNDLTIILTTSKKIDSGMELSYKELKSVIKELCNSPETKVAAKAHFGNYTQSSTATMKINLETWYKNNNKKCDCKFEKCKKDSTKELEEVQAVLETKTFEKDTVNVPLYKEGLKYVLTGVKMMQNATFNSELSTMSEEELSKVLTKIIG